MLDTALMEGLSVESNGDRSLQRCASSCMLDARCRAFTWNRSNKMCSHGLGHGDNGNIDATEVPYFLEV